MGACVTFLLFTWKKLSTHLSPPKGWMGSGGCFQDKMSIFQEMVRSKMHKQFLEQGPEPKPQPQRKSQQLFQFLSPRHPVLHFWQFIPAYASTPFQLTCLSFLRMESTTLGHSGLFPAWRLVTVGPWQRLSIIKINSKCWEAFPQYGKQFKSYVLSTFSAERLLSCKCFSFSLTVQHQNAAEL